jgi:hypothetical protein
MADDRFDLPSFAVPSHLRVKAAIQRFGDLPFAFGREDPVLAWAASRRRTPTWGIS